MPLKSVVRGVVVFCMLGAVAAALAMPLGAKDASKIVAFLGRFHVLALHVPIGVLVVALLGEAGTFLRRGRRYADVVVGFALPLLVLTGFAAIFLGLMLGHSGHYPHKLIAPHRNLTILGVVLAGGAALLWDRRRKTRVIHRALLGGSALTMMIGAHFGGSMTHGVDYLTAPVIDEPPPAGPDDADAAAPVVDASPRSDPDGAVAVAVAPDAGVEDGGSTQAGAIDAAAPVDAGPPKPTSKQLAQAVINRRCAPCHTTNQKGGLRMTNVAAPGKRGVLVPGHPESSSMYTRLLLPMDDDDHMPPEGEPQVTKADIAAIRAFIAEQK